MANKTITVLEADGTTETDVVSLDVGRQAAAASKSLALSTEDKAVLDLLATAAKQDTAKTAIDAVTTAVTTATVTNGPMRATIVTPADAQITRPSDTTAYAIGDLIANSTTAGSVTRLSWTGATKTGSGGTGRIVGFVGRKSGTVAATIRYHFLKTDHAVTNGDNGALVLTSLDVDNYFGYMDVTWGAAENVGSSGESVAKSYDAPLPYVLGSGDTIYCVMQALVAFTPANGGTLGGRPIFEVWT